MGDTAEGQRDQFPFGPAPFGPALAGDPALAGEPALAGDPVPARDPGRPASRAEATGRTARRRIGIRELRQHASVYVDLAQKGYTVDITNRGRLVAQLVPVREPGSPLERLIAAGIIEPAEEPGGVGDIEPYPVRGAWSTADEIGGPGGPDAPRPDSAPDGARPEDRR